MGPCGIPPEGSEGARHPPRRSPARLVIVHEAPRRSMPKQRSQDLGVRPSRKPSSLANPARSSPSACARLARHSSTRSMYEPTRQVIAGMMGTSAIPAPMMVRASEITWFSSVHGSSLRGVMPWRGCLGAPHPARTAWGSVQLRRVQCAALARSGGSRRQRSCAVIGRCGSCPTSGARTANAS